MPYNYLPQLWYWLADDGRIYSGPEQRVVNDSDPGYGTFLSDGNRANQWPRDNDGNQTNAAMLAVVSAYGMFVDLESYAADKRWRKETGGLTVSGVPLYTDDRSKQMLMGARIAADADANFTTVWAAADGNLYPLDAATIIAISNAVLAHVNSCFETYATVVNAIKADPPTITTRAQIDEAFA